MQPTSQASDQINFDQRPQHPPTDNSINYDDRLRQSSNPAGINYDGQGAPGGGGQVGPATNAANTAGGGGSNYDRVHQHSIGKVLPTK